MTTSGEQSPGPLGSATSPAPGQDGADGMAGPVYPPPETEPDATPESARRSQETLGSAQHDADGWEREG